MIRQVEPQETLPNPTFQELVDVCASTMAIKEAFAQPDEAIVSFRMQGKQQYFHGQHLNNYRRGRSLSFSTI
jgi:hypothetical protein